MINNFLHARWDKFAHISNVALQRHNLCAHLNFENRRFLNDPPKDMAGEDIVVENVVLKAEEREITGKSTVKKLRQRSKVPAVIYRKGKTGANVFVDKKDVLKVLHTKAGENVLINLEIMDADKDKNKTVIIKEIQHDPITREMLHIDFYQISLTERIKINVPLMVKGDAPGIKEGGILEHVIREVEIECLPTKIPESIDIDVSNMNIGDVMHLKDIALPVDLHVLTNLEQVVVLIKAPVEEKAAEEAVITEAAPAEPEVIKQKKPEAAAEGETKEEK
ncbi:MAG: 50S ribosomal protein L25 [Candidatus Omnitrophota bacterium]